MSGTNSQIEAIASLAKTVLLEVFDEQDQTRRTQAIARAFTPDVQFIDHGGVHNGRGEIDVAVQQLHRLLPGYRFAHIGEPQLLTGAARLKWQFGPPSDPGKIAGSDTILVKNGRVSLLLVFLD
jgi:hypothetical protein